MNLANLDLNLLVALNALLEERHVTRAAHRLGLSQSAMSGALGRLRELLGDPLLVRTSQGMAPTPRAHAIAGPLRLLLEQIEQTLSPPPAFDPARSDRTFTLCTADYGELVLLPELMRRLATGARGLNIAIHPATGERMWRELEAGRIDLLIGLFNQLPAGACRQVLFKEEFVCLVREDHPGVGETLSLEQYVLLPHILVSPAGGPGGIVDTLLEARGLKRRIVLQVAHFLVAPQVLAHSDYVLTVPARLARAFTGRLPLRSIPPPLELPGFAFSQVWHERTHHDPAHRWLREQLAEIARGV